MIELRHVRKAYPNSIPLQNVSVTINDGDIISVIGPSGTGKSTLLRCINLLDKPTSGQIIVDNVDITSPNVKISDVRKKIGMVFQNFNLFAHLTVVENIMLAPMDLLKISRQEAYDKAIELLHLVGMEERALNYPDMLSGGQKQRVAIARTLAMDPDIILFDEPTSALDPTMVGEVQSVIRELATMGKTMMIVTHEMRFAREISNRVFYMDQGGIYEDGTPKQIFEAPEKELTRRFIYHLKVFEKIIENSEFDFHGAVGELERFGYKNMIPVKTLYRIQSVFEEMCQQILLPHYGKTRICFTVEYDELKNRATVVFMYSGDIFDPSTTDNKLALSIIQKHAERMVYSKKESEDYQNMITVEI